MTFEMIVVIVIGLAIVLLGVLVLYKLLPKRTKKSAFQSKWKEIYQFCGKKETWPIALDRADKLLDMALKRKRYKGKNMGERLVAAQKVFTDNDSIWLAHKLSTKLRDHPKARINEKQVKEALVSMRQGLKDLDVL